MNCDVMSPLLNPEWLKNPRFFIPSAIINNVPITNMFQRCFIIENSQTNRRDSHKIYLQKEVRIEVHRNPEDGVAPSSWEGGDKEAMYPTGCEKEPLKNFKYDQFEC